MDAIARVDMDHYLPQAIDSLITVLDSFRVFHYRVRVSLVLNIVGNDLVKGEANQPDDRQKVRV
jgi:hypothetical protein